MSWIYYKNTEATALKLKHDILLIGKIVDLVVQILFIGYYLFQTIAYRDKTLFHIIYAIFLIAGIFLLGFVLLFKDKVNKDTKSNVRKIVRYVKYPIRAALIIMSIVDISKNGGGTLSILIIALSIVFYFLQIFIQLILRFIRRYLDLFSESIKMDYEESDALRAIYNFRKYPQKKKGTFSSFAFNKVAGAAQNFVNENKDSAPKAELTEKQEEIRKDINEYKKDYIIEDSPDIEYDDNTVYNEQNDDPNIVVDDKPKGFKEKLFSFLKK